MKKSEKEVVKRYFEANDEIIKCLSESKEVGYELEFRWKTARQELKDLTETNSPTGK